MPMDIPTIKCDRCERVWPQVSEQGLHTDVYGHCYSCMISSVMKALVVLQEEVDYVVTTCNICAGTEESRVDCKQCATLGYIVDKKK